MPERAKRRDIVVVGASIGGIAALQTLVSGLSADFPGSIFIVTHLSPESFGSLPEILSKAGPLPASNAENGQTIEPGQIYVAPPDRHLLIRDQHHMQISYGPKENRFRPAVDPLFRSAALVFGPRVAGVVLTGGLDDGTAGLAAIKSAGGLAIVQDPAEAEVDSMPRSALRYVAVDHCLKIGGITALLSRLARLPAPAAEVHPKRPIPTEIEVQVMARTGVREPRVNELGEPSIFTCPECHGTLLRVREHSPLRFRCHTGHGFTAASLDAALNESIEDSLWNSVRSLQEQTMLLNHMVEHANGEEDLIRDLRQRAGEAERRAEMLRKVLLRNSRPGEEPSHQ